MGRVLNPRYFRCTECGRKFDEYQLKQVFEDYEAWGRTFYEAYFACPHCESIDIVESEAEDE